jgi:Trypsin-like peptidase domain
MHDNHCVPAGKPQGRTLALAFSALVLSGACAGAASSKGTAFAVASDGTLVTNEHVVAGCLRVMAHLGVQAFPGMVTATDHANDLAIVKLRVPTQLFATLRGGPNVRLGEQVVTYGFPLVGALTTEGNLTMGNVSGLRGLRDDAARIQISVPVQPGNSGGPLVDMSANVVGVVASKLDAMRVMNAIGDLPQNVNFAIALDPLRRFLQSNRVRVTEDESAAELRPADIGDRLRGFTYLIDCQSSPVGPVAQTLPPAQPAPALTAGNAGAGDDAAPATPAQKECMNELVATKQLLLVTQSGVRATLQSPPPDRCRAIQQYYTAMMTARDVFSRCDTSGQRGQHTATLDTSIDKFKRSIPSDCQQ